MKESTKYLLGLLLIYTMIRIPIMLSDPYVDLDILDQGVFALDLWQGVGVSLLDYEFNPYGLGRVLAGFWLALFMPAFGTSLFVNKMAAFFWHFLSLMVWFFVFKKHFELKKVFLILLFFVFVPPETLRFTLLNVGYHFEMILWMGLSLLLFQNFLLGKFSQSWGAILLGLMTGLSSALIPTSLLIVATIWIYIFFIRDPSFRRSSFLGIFSCAWLIGFSPWLLYNFSLYGEGVVSLANMFPAENFTVRIMKNLFELFFVPELGFQGLFGFSSLPKKIGFPFAAIYLFCFLIGFIHLCRKSRFFWRNLSGSLRLEVFALIFCFLLVGSAVLKGSGMLAYYYLFPIVPFVGMFIVAASFRNRWLQNGMTAFCLASGLVGNLGLIDFGNFGNTLKRPGYSYGLWAAEYESKLCEWSNQRALFRKKLVQFVKGRDPKLKETIYRALTGKCFELYSQGDFALVITDIETRHEKEFQPILFEKLGTQLGMAVSFDPEKLKRWLSLPEVSRDFLPDLYRGVVQGLNWTDWDYPRAVEAGILLCRAAPIEAKGECYKGLGLLDDRNDFSAGVFKHFDWMTPLVEEKYRPNFLKGVGENVVFDVEITKKFLVSLDGDERKWFVAGHEAGRLKIEDPFERDKIK